MTTSTEKAAWIAAQQAVLDEIYADLIAFVEPLPAASLSWTPTDDATNTIAALVRHCVGSLNAWLSLAVGDAFERDREAEFHYEAKAGELIAMLEQSREASRLLLARLASVDPGVERDHARVARHAGQVRVTVAWCVEHALVHVSEHWGQIQLTSQLWQVGHTRQAPAVSEAGD